MPASCWFCCPAFGLLPGDHERVAENAERLATAIDATCRLGHGLEMSEGAPWVPFAERQQDLLEAWNHDLCWPLRGGSGCLHLLDTLATLQTPAPLLLGYSDITILHAWWFRHGWGETVYTAMAGDRAIAERTLASLTTCLDGRPWSLDTTCGGHGLRAGHAHGPSFVACLRVLTTCCGTPAQPDLTDCILFLEDIDERPYAIDRDLWQLFHAGVLSGIAGMVVSNFPGERPSHDRGPELAGLWRWWGNRLGVPVVMGVPFGHEPEALSLPSGRPTSLQVGADDDWRLEFSPR